MRLGRSLFYTVSVLAILVAPHVISRHAVARDFGQYINVPQEIREWYRNAELTPAAQRRLQWKKCCDHADVVKTQFRVNKSTSDDEWYWLHDGEWKRIPPDIIHWGVSAPGGEPVLFVCNSVETCFFPGQSSDAQRQPIFTQWRSAMLRVVQCALHARRRALRVGREKMVDTIAVPSTPSLAWSAPSQRSSLAGGRCHEAAAITDVSIRVLPARSHWPRASSIPSAHLQIRLSSIRAWPALHSRPP